MTSAHLFVLALCGALFASGLDASEKRSFSGYSVLRAQVQDRDQAEALHNLEQTGKHDFWTDVKLEVRLWGTNPPKAPVCFTIFHLMDS